MSDQQIHPDEEYVLVPRKRIKLSRMRKGIIGAMLVGSVAALTGAGTFASFSATTSNDAAFKTIRVALQNNTSSTTCLSPAAATGGTGTINAAIDTNDATGCGELFPTALAAGVNTTATVDVKNVGDNAGNLYVFAPAACTVAAANTSFNTGSGTHGTNGQLCGQVVFTLHNGVDCLWPSQSGACPTLGDSATTTFQSFASTATFGAKITAASSLAVNATKSFTVVARLKQITGCTADSDTDSNNDGFTDNKGIGCDNKFQNEKATMSFRWLMQA